MGSRNLSDLGMGLAGLAESKQARASCKRRRTFRKTIN
jgi:hypothetical protein